jgi:hypothetical protein
MEDCTRYILSQLSVYDVFVMRYVNSYFQQRCAAPVTNDALLHWSARLGYVDLLFWLVAYVECVVTETLKTGIVYEAVTHGRKSYIQTLVRFGVISVSDVRKVANNLLENEVDSLSMATIAYLCELRVPRALKLSRMDVRDILFEYVVNQPYPQVEQLVRGSGTILTNDVVLRVARLDSSNYTAASNFLSLLKLGLVSHITHDTSEQYVSILTNTKNKLVGQRSDILLRLVSRGLKLICPVCAKPYKIRDSYVSHLYTIHDIDITQVLRK